MNINSERRNLTQLYRPPPPEDYSQNYCRLTTVIIIATIFIALEIVGGTLSGSIAIISDAIHLVSDLLGFVFSILFLYLSKKQMDKKVTFGYHRMELVGALMNIFIVWVMVLFIIYEATLRIINKQFVKNPFIMLITAGGGLLINILLYKILHGGSSHSHGLLNDNCQGHDHEGHQHNHQHHKHQHGNQKQHQSHEAHQQHQHKKHHQHNHQAHQQHKHSCSHQKIAEQKENPILIKSLDQQIIHKHQHEHQPKKICQGNHNHDEHKQAEVTSQHANGKKQHANCKGHQHHQGHNHQKNQNNKGHVQKKDLEEGLLSQHSQHCVHQHQQNGQNVPEKHQSIGMKSAIIHALSDLVQSVGVVISAVIIFLFGSDYGAQVSEWNEFHLFDPIATYIFSVLSLLATLPVIQNCYYLLMESAPNHIDLDKLKQECQKIEGVIDVHDIHVWDLKPGKTIMMAHVLSKYQTQRAVLMGLTDLCRRKKIFHSTFQVQQEGQSNKDDYILCHHDIH